MSILMSWLNAGANDDMRLSEWSRLRVINGSIFIAAFNILAYNLTFFFFAPEIAVEMSLFRTLCGLTILSAWLLNKKQLYKLCIHVLLISSMLSVFHVTYFYLGPEYGYQKLFIIFSVIPFIYFTKNNQVERLLYSITNLSLYFYFENASFNYIFTTDFRYYNSTIAEVFNNLNIVIGFVTIVIVMFIYDYIIGRDEEALIVALESAKYHAEYDYLTDTMNRRSMSGLLKDRLADESLLEKPLSIIMWDVDDFKRVNDEEGHAQGDIVLRALSSYINENFGEVAHLSRWGGEEFVVLLDDCTFDETVAIAEDIRLGIESLRFVNDRSVTISLGVTSRKPEDTFSSLLLRVDHLMYQAKHKGKNQVVSSK